MKISKIITHALGCFTLSSMMIQAAQVANFSQILNDRFRNDPSFIANGFNLSGVGRTSDGQWATRIGANYYLSANHFHPSNGETVTFHASNNPSGTTYSYVSAGGFQISGSDLWLGYFNETINSSVTTYSYNTTAANSLAGAGINLAEVFMVGNSQTGDSVYGGPGSLTDMVVAQNRAESWYETGTNTVLAAGVTNAFVNGSGSPLNATWDQIVTFRNVSGDNFYTGTDQRTHEGQLISGDSGSPLFSVVSGQLRVEGIAYSVVTLGGGVTGDFVSGGGLEQREATFYSYTGSLNSGINAAISNVPVPIPEPSQAMLLLLGAGVMLRRKRSIITLS